MWEELACKDAARTPYPEEWQETRGRALADAFEALRRECGDRPLAILSAYRTPEHNETVKNSASKSRHIEGRAIDVVQPSYLVTYGEFLAAAFRAREKCPAIRGIGIYHKRRSVHIDVRESEYLATWQG